MCLCVCMSTYLFLCHVFSVIWPGAFCVSVCPHIYFCAMFSVSFGLVHFVCLYVHILIFVPCFQCHLAWCILCVCMSTYLFLCHVFSVIWPGAFCVSVCPHIYFCAMFSVSFGLVHFVCLYVHIFIFVPCFQCHLAWCILCVCMSTYLFLCHVFSVIWPGAFCGKT